VHTRHVSDLVRVCYCPAPGFDAAEELGVGMEEFTELAACHGVQTGRWSRYARTDIERLRRALLAASSARRKLAG
jgi:hypothetical protein